MAVIDYYFYGASPFSYLGHRELLAAAKRQSATINYKPVNLFALWEVSGAVPPTKRPPVRQRYRLIELQRVAEFRGLPINLKPKFWPIDTTVADQAVIALVEAGHSPADYIQKVLAGIWADELDLSDNNVIAGLLSDCGFDADAILERATVQRYRRHSGQKLGRSSRGRTLSAYRPMCSLARSSGARTGLNCLNMH